MPLGYLFEGLERRKNQREASVLQLELPAVFGGSLSTILMFERETQIQLINATELSV